MSFTQSQRAGFSYSLVNAVEACALDHLVVAREARVAGANVVLLSTLRADDGARFSSGQELVRVEEEVVGQGGCLEIGVHVDLWLLPLVLPNLLHLGAKEALNVLLRYCQLIIRSNHDTI